MTTQKTHEIQEYKELILYIQKQLFEQRCIYNKDRSNKKYVKASNVLHKEMIEARYKLRELTH